MCCERTDFFALFEQPRSFSIIISHIRFTNLINNCNLILYEDWPNQLGVAATPYIEVESIVLIIHILACVWIFICLFSNGPIDILQNIQYQRSCDVFFFFCLLFRIIRKIVPNISSFYRSNDCVQQNFETNRITAQMRYAKNPIARISSKGEQIELVALLHGTCSQRVHCPTAHACVYISCVCCFLPPYIKHSTWK